MISTSRALRFRSTPPLIPRLPLTSLYPLPSSSSSSSSSSSPSSCSPNTPPQQTHDQRISHLEQRTNLHHSLLHTLNLRLASYRDQLLFARPRAPSPSAREREQKTYTQQDQATACLHDLVEGMMLVNERLARMKEWDAEREKERERDRGGQRKEGTEDKGEENGSVPRNAFMHARQVYTTNVYLREISDRIDGVNARLDKMQWEMQLARRRAEKDDVEKEDGQDAVEARVQGMRREMRGLGKRVERLLALAERRVI